MAEMKISMTGEAENKEKIIENGVNRKYGGNGEMA
jgi:hypothetical protein